MYINIYVSYISKLIDIVHIRLTSLYVHFQKVTKYWLLSIYVLFTEVWVCNYNNTYAFHATLYRFCHWLAPSQLWTYLSNSMFTDVGMLIDWIWPKGKYSYYKNKQMLQIFLFCSAFLKNNLLNIYQYTINEYIEDIKEPGFPLLENGFKIWGKGK